MATVHYTLNSVYHTLDWPLQTTLHTAHYKSTAHQSLNMPQGSPGIGMIHSRGLSYTVLFRIVIPYSITVANVLHIIVQYIIVYTHTPNSYYCTVFIIGSQLLVESLPLYHCLVIII